MAKMSNYDADMIALALFDKHHDKDLSKALIRWGVSQNVPSRILMLSCLRTASYCLATMLQKDLPRDPETDCVIIEAYASYFHFYVHVAQDFIKKQDEKKK